jgi:6-pyruvoyltetrahydropterin/6-carboxytetrahydropterin synthase
VYPFGGFKKIKAFMVDMFDHKLLVAKDDPKLDELQKLRGDGLANPVLVDAVGAEAFAMLVASVFLHHLKDPMLIGPDRGLRLVSVMCSEREGNSAIYYPPVGGD